MTIKEVEERTGLARSNIRFYEKEKLIEPARNDKNGYRDYSERDIENIKKLRELQKELPSFCSDFFRGIETSTSTRTRIAYAYDLKIFFQFLKTANPGTFGNPSHTLTPSDLEKLTVTDLEEYIDYLKCHPSDTNEDVINTERGLMRKVSSLRSFYSYFFRNERIEKNPAALVRMPKLHEKGNYPSGDR